MSSGSWFNKDGLYLQYGTAKATPTTGGEYRTHGLSRSTEIDIDISKLTTTASIQDYVTFFPAGVFIDSVVVEATTAALTITSLSVGTMKLDQSTGISDTSFVNALVLASIDGQGETTTLTGPPASGGAGASVGTTFGADPAYITAKIAGSVGTGIIKVRINWHGVTPITQ